MSSSSNRSSEVSFRTYPCFAGRARWT
jgi:hypothetical protein